MKGKIEAKYPEEFEVIKSKAFEVWDNYKGVYSDVPYYEAGQTIGSFLMGSFFKTRIRIGDGIGLSGEVTIPDCHDSHLKTAMVSMWRHYRNARPENYKGKS